jgi:hypothetical protein
MEWEFVLQADLWFVWVEAAWVAKVEFWEFTSVAFYL